MQLPPNFAPRGGGRARGFQYTADDCDCRYCLHAPKPRMPCGVAVTDCPCLEERLETGCVSIADLIAALLPGVRSPELRRRIGELTQERPVTDLLFLSPRHQALFNMVITDRGLRYSADTGMLAALFLALDRDPRGYAVGFNGGKDSLVVKQLCKEAGVRHFCVYNITGLDPPELVYFKRKRFAEYEGEGDPCRDLMYRHNIMQLMRMKNMPPTRLVRYCCEHLKEMVPPDLQTCVYSFGVRQMESRSRAANRDEMEVYRQQSTQKFAHDNHEHRGNFEVCYASNPYGQIRINPIARGWSDGDVWDFIRDRKLEYFCLYDEGFTRLGCAGCPMAGKKRVQEFERWPGLERVWLRARNILSTFSPWTSGGIGGWSSRRSRRRRSLGSLNSTWSGETGLPRKGTGRSATAILQFLFGTKEQPPDFDQVHALLLTEAQGGNVLAMHDLGRMHADGLGREIDTEAAHGWYAKALAGILAVDNTNIDYVLHFFHKPIYFT